MSTIEVGELLYEYTVKITGMTEYGVSLESLMAGEVAPPPEGARFDVAFEGASSGPKLKGKVTGVDYLRIRADGRFQLHIHAEITADDGQKIALHAVVFDRLERRIINARRAAGRNDEKRIEIPHGEVARFR